MQSGRQWVESKASRVTYPHMNQNHMDNNFVIHMTTEWMTWSLEKQSKATEKFHELGTC